MDEGIQLKFKNPDIDGTPGETIVVLEKEMPIEGESTREDGEPFIWHKWLCTNNQYFMASASLDAMLKAIPNKVGKPTKIEKVVNPKGGFPFFMVNGMSKDDIASHAPMSTPNKPELTTSVPPQTTNVPASNDSSIDMLNHKIDRVIELLTKLVAENKNTVKEEELPF